MARVRQGDGLFKFRHIHRVIICHIDEHRHGSRMHDGGDGGHAGMCHRNHFVSRAHSQPRRAKSERIQSAVHTHGVTSADEGREIPLEFTQFVPQDQVAPLDTFITVSKISSWMPAKCAGTLTKGT